MTADDPTATPLRVAVVGSTTWSDQDQVVATLDGLLAPENRVVVITGMADGADAWARQWAVANGHTLKAEPLETGPYPGPMHRYNELMMRLCPDVVLAFKDEFSPDWRSSSCVAGTEHFCRLAAEAGVPVVLYRGSLRGEEQDETERSSAGDRAETAPA